MLIQREISHPPLQSAVLLFQLSEPAELAHAQMRIFLLPGVEGLLGDAILPAQIANWGAGLGLAEGIDDLLFREFRPLHRSAPFVEDRQNHQSTPVLTCRRLRG
jgi:hypothetical protein